SVPGRSAPRAVLPGPAGRAAPPRRSCLNAHLPRVAHARVAPEPGGQLVHPDGTAPRRRFDSAPVVLDGARADACGSGTDRRERSLRARARRGGPPRGAPALGDPVAAALLP